MSHLFFHLHNSEGWVQDLEGREVSDLAAVERIATCEARALIAADVTDGQPVHLSNYISVDDETGAEIARVRYSEVVTFS